MNRTTIPITYPVDAPQVCPGCHGKPHPGQTCGYEPYEPEMNSVDITMERNPDMWHELALGLEARVKQLEEECKGKGNMISAQQDLRDSLRSEIDGYRKALEPWGSGGVITGTVLAWIANKDISIAKAIINGKSAVDRALNSDVKCCNVCNSVLPTVNALIGMENRYGVHRKYQ